MDEKALTGGEAEAALAYLKAALSGKGAMDQIVVPDGGAEGMKAFTVFKAALVEGDVSAPIQSGLEEIFQLLFFGV